MDPHEVIVDVVGEDWSLAAMPCEEDKIAFRRWMLLDISDLALAEHLSPPVPRIAEVSDKSA